MLKTLSLLILLLSFSACSVVLALQGKDEPDISVLEIGATRQQIELQLGSPVSSQKNEYGGTTDTYEYVMGDEPSPGRALAHGAMDVLTLAIWEVIGTPIELAHGEKRLVEVEYDQNDYAMFLRKGTPQSEEKVSESEYSD